MSKANGTAKVGILLLAIVIAQGCGGGNKDGAAPATAEAGGGAAPAGGGAMPAGGEAGGPMPSSYAPGAQAGAGGAAAETAGIALSGPEADGYREGIPGGSAAALPGDMPMPGDATAGPNYGANYAANAGIATPGGATPDGVAGYPGGVSGLPGDGPLGLGGGLAPPRDPAPPEDADYLTKAKYAFAIGKEAAAQQYLYAHILTRDDEAPALLKEFRWLPAAARPTATSRFAVGVILSAAGNITDLKPIGTPQMTGGGANQGGGIGGDAGMGAQTGKAGSSGRTFQDITGDLGKAVVTAFESRWTAGEFGTIFKDVAAITPFERAPSAFAGGDGAYGGPGIAGPGMEAGGAFGAGGLAGAGHNTVAGKSIVPGLLFLGTGSEGELLNKAEKEGIHGLFLFDVKAELTRIGVVQNDTRIRLVVVGGKSIGATPTFNNVKIERNGNADIDKYLPVLFKKLDAPAAPALGLKLADLPAIKPEHAKGRISKLVAAKSKDVLGTLTEIRLFHSLGLITDAEKSQAYQLVLDGSDGEILASGAEEDRQALLKSKLPAYK